MKKQRLTQQEHIELGIFLKDCHDSFVKMYVRLSKAYGTSSKARTRANALCKALNKLRSHLDDIVVEDFPESKWPHSELNKIYYGRIPYSDKDPDLVNG